MDVPPRSRTPLKREFYLAYLNSPEWRTKRRDALRRAEYRCQAEGCTSKRGLQVHHLTYERLGAELDDDLVVVCEDCHESHHIAEMEKSESRVFLKIGRIILGKLGPWASIADLSEAVKGECARLKIKYDAHQIDKALNLLCSSAQKPRPMAAHPTARESSVVNRGLTHAESRELLARLGLRGAFIKTMPAISDFIDIYGPIERDEPEYDRY